MKGSRKAHSKTGGYCEVMSNVGEPKTPAIPAQLVAFSLKLHAGHVEAPNAV
jgi:hypothetical protein